MVVIPDSLHVVGKWWNQKNSSKWLFIFKDKFCHLRNISLHLLHPSGWWYLYFWWASWIQGGVSAPPATWKCVQLGKGKHIDIPDTVYLLGKVATVGISYWFHICISYLTNIRIHLDLTPRCRVHSPTIHQLAGAGSDWAYHSWDRYFYTDVGLLIFKW